MGEPLNLYQKISAVMKDIQYLQKDDKVSTGASGSYKAMSEEKVTQVVRESLITHGLVILPVEQSHSRDELRDKENVLKSYLSIVETKYKIVDIDTGQFEMLASGGTGADTQDKGIGKAMTYSYKYLLLRTFAIPTGDDPDKVSSDVLDEQHEKSKQPAQSYPSTYNRPQVVPDRQSYNPPPTQTQANTVPSSAPSDLISKPQIGMIQKLLKEKQILDETYRNLLIGFGVTSSKELTKRNASDLIKKLTDYVVQAPELEEELLPF